MSEDQVVRYEVEDGIGVIIVDNPPVNALGPGVREGIIEAVERGNADASVSAMVLIGAGRSFIAGADIRQFGKARAVTTGQSTKALDESAKPVVAAIHGYALGGGLEHALACHYRVAVPSAKVGLPEVLIGILPGGGGTQRLPRLIGPKAAMEMIVSGRHVPAPEAKQLGIIDELVDEKDLRGAAIRFAKGVASKRPLPRVRDKSDRLAEAKSDPGHVRSDAQIDRAQGPQPEGAVQLHRGSRSSHDGADRSKPVSKPSACSSPSSRIPTKRRRCATRSSPNAKWRRFPARRRITSAPRVKIGGGRRRRHDGRRHRDVASPITASP